MTNKLQIRNSTAEFLSFTSQAGEDGIEVRVADETVWLTQKPEDQAERNFPMTMEDWANKLNAFLQFNERDILDNPGKVFQEIAKAFAESDFEKCRIVQDRMFESDFDKTVKCIVGSVAPRRSMGCKK
jgi:hypothetical protein